MIEAILANTLGGILSDVFGTVLKQPVKRMLDEHEMQRSLLDAIKRAEERFARDNHQIDAELTSALMAQTRFVDTPTVRSALKEMLIHPFRDPTQTVTTLQRSFTEVLPARVDREQVDEAVHTFLRYLSEEVLYIPQLQPLYALVFQKMSAESSRDIAMNTAVLAESMRNLHVDLKELPQTLATSALTVIEESSVHVRALPWHNLPQRTYAHFIGREAELRKLTQLLLPYPRSRHFLVTLDGIGGVGKSALALEVAYHYRDSYETLPQEERFEAIVWISAKRTMLTANGIQSRQQTFSTLGDLYREIATVLELPMIMQVDVEQRRGLVEHALSGKRTLLIVDNLETVDDEEILTFLRELPDPTKAIVTTRHRIDIAYAIRLTGMPQADARALIKLEAAHKSVHLPTDSIEDLFRRTGGIPLAIVWSIALMSLGYGVESVLRRLGSGHSDIARFCFEESIAHIRDRDAYRMLAALALFEASVKRKMLGEVAGLGNDEIGRDDALAELLQLSLVNQEGDRFSLLPLTRSFVLDELEHRPELEQTLREEWFTHLIILARPYADLHLRGHDLRMVQQEGAHFVTLSSWCQQTGRPDILLKVFPALAYYYDCTGQWTDLLILGQNTLEYAQLTGDLDNIVFIETLVLSWMLCDQGRYEEAERYIADALKTVRQLGDPSWHCSILVNYARVYRMRGMFEQAFSYCQQALQLVPIVAETQQIYLRAYIEYELGKLNRDLCDWQEAQRHLYAARDVFRHDESDPVFNLELAWGILSNLGFVEHQLGNLDAAEQIYLQCLGFFKELGSRGTMTTLLTRIALLEEQRGNLIAAKEYANEALYWSRRLGMVEEQSQVEALETRLLKNKTTPSGHE
jgi:tetratricopeptide (TPR) repeat protein